MRGPTRIFWANLTPFSLKEPQSATGAAGKRAAAAEGPLQKGDCVSFRAVLDDSVEAALGLGRSVALYYLPIHFIP